MNYDNNPLLFSINSLVCHKSVLDAHKDMLASCEAVWFEVVGKLKADHVFRTNVANECVAMIETQGHREHNLTNRAFEILFGPGGDQYELFPDAPGHLMDEVVNDLRRVTNEFRGTRMTKDMILKTLEEFSDVIDTKIPREQYPAL